MTDEQRPDAVAPVPEEPATGAFAEPGSTPGTEAPPPVPPGGDAPVPPPPDTGFEPPLAPPPEYAAPPVEGFGQAAPPSDAPPGYPPPERQPAAAPLLAGDGAVVVAGVVTFILTLFHGYFTVSLTIRVADSQNKITVSGNAWHTPPWGYLGGIAGLLGAGVLAAALFGGVAAPAPLRRLSGTLMGLAALFTLFALFFTPGAEVRNADAFGIHLDSGHGAVYWIALIVSIAGAAAAGLRLIQTGALRRPGG